VSSVVYTVANEAHALGLFAPRPYAGAVLCCHRVYVCPSARLSVCLSQGGIVSKRLDESSSFLALHLSHILCYKEIWVCPQIRVLPSGSSSRTPGAGPLSNVMRTTRWRIEVDFANELGCHGNVSWGIEKNNLRSFIYDKRATNRANFVKIGPVDAEIIGPTKPLKKYLLKQQQNTSPARLRRTGATWLIGWLRFSGTRCSFKIRVPPGSMSIHSAVNETVFYVV